MALGAHMGTLGHTWVPWAPHGYLGAPHGYLGAHMGTLGHTWVPWGTHGYLGAHMGTLGPTWVPWGPTWVPWGTHGYLGAHMGTLGHTWIPFGPTWVPCGTHGHLMGLYFPSLSPRGYHMGKTSWALSRTYTGTMGMCLLKSDAMRSQCMLLLCFIHCFPSTYTNFTIACY